MVVKTFITMDYNEVDKLINDNFFDGKRKFECVPCEEWSNDASYRRELDGEWSEFEKEYELPEIEKRSKDMGMTWNYLNMLATMGTLPKGEYLIEVSW